MNLRTNVKLIMGLLSAVTLLGPMFAYADVQIEGRPTRPKDFDDVDELQDYLNLLKDVYILKGKARYGKRAEFLRNINVTPNYSTELLRSKFNDYDEVFEKIQSNAEENKKSRRHPFSQERYSEIYNKLRIPYQISRLKLSPNSNVLEKTHDSRKQDNYR